MHQQTNQQANRNELLDLAALLVELKRKWPDLYRHLMGIIKVAIK